MSMIITGMHVIPKFGNTYQEVLKIWKKIFYFGIKKKFNIGNNTIKHSESIE